MTHFFNNHSGKLLLIFLVLAPAVFWASLRAYDKNDNSIAQWLPKGDNTTTQFDQFRDHFGSGEFMLVSWVDCTLDDPRLEDFAVAIEELSSAGDVESPFASVTTGQRLYDILLETPFDLSHEQACRRLSGVLLGTDNEATCAVITMVKSADVDREFAVAQVQKIATEQCDVAREDLRVTGDAAISAAIDKEGQEAISRWILPSACVSLAVAFLCLRSIRFVIIVFVLAMSSQFSCEAAIYLSGAKMNLFLTLAPILVFVLTLSASVHMTNYYWDARGEVKEREAPAEALRLGWQPCLISSVTTSLGLISLCVSQVAPVRHFGMYGAAGVLLSFGLLALLFPAALTRFSPRNSAPSSGRLNWNPAANLIVRRALPLVALFLVGIAGLGFGLTKISTNVEPTRFLPADTRALNDSRWWIETIGRLTPLEIVIEFGGECELSYEQRLKLVSGIGARLRQFEQIDGVTSAATFSPRPMKTSGSSLSQQMRRFAYQRALKRSREEVERAGLVSNAQGGLQYWRVTARMQRDKDLPFVVLRDRLDAAIHPVVDATGEAQRVKVIYTGGVPLVYAAQKELLRALILSFSLALVLIAIVMSIVLRSVVAGVASMLPNLFPALAAFGLMGWSGSPVDVGAMMTASIALGIAVDDTLHFLTWRSRAIRAGASDEEAIREAFRRCASAMLSTTLIAGLGLLPFAFSSFQPVAQFGRLMFILLVAALVGDLLLLPAMLASRFGRWCFGGEAKRMKRAQA
ncbi:MAG: MMPL family transporter [Pirellulaceae bacterium]|jgi:hypothetical protein|nr:MMPL family transporter [Pirellulaceae bacterium]MDP7018243.1 MMPL family transporter [Pirellulaceae bacterium]